MGGCLSESASACGVDSIQSVDRHVIVRIFGDVDFHEVGEEKQEKGVIYYEEFSRAMVLNRTNLKRIVGIYGNDTDEWTGKQISLYPSETDFGGRTVPCIRVREKAPK